MKILLTDATDIDIAWPGGATPVRFSESEPIPTEHLDADVVIGWGDMKSLRSLKNMPNLRLVQSLSAGTDAFIAAGLPEGAQLASGRGLHDRTVTEHAVALLLSMVRELPTYFSAQEQRVWLDEKRHPKPVYDPERVSTLLDARVLIWGFGSIGQRLAPALTALGATVRGVAQSGGTRAGFPVIAAEDIKGALPDTDILVMILPATESTKNALNEELIGLLPNRSLVCNVGRGKTVDEDALIAALANGELAGAALDVTAQEPLPPESALWDAPNCIITPHVAGYRADGAEELVRENLSALSSEGQIRNLVRP